MNMNRMRRPGIFVAAALMLTVGISCSAGDDAKARSLEQRKAAWSVLRKKVERFNAQFNGTAGIMIKDFASGETIAINPSKVFPAASLVKIPIMAGCFQAIAEKRLSLESEITLGSRDITPGSGVLKTKPAGSVYTVEQLIELMIAESDNTATNILISKLTPEYLNAFFERQGLTSTRLERKMMDFSRRRKGVENFTSASDVAMLLERMYLGRCVNADASRRCIAILLRQKMKDRIPKRLPRDTPVAHKTGLERNVCHDAGIVFTPAGDFLVCVLTRSTSKGGYRAMKDFIAKTAREVYNTYQPAPPADTGSMQRSSQGARSARSSS